MIFMAEEKTEQKKEAVKDGKSHEEPKAAVRKEERIKSIIRKGQEEPQTERTAVRLGGKVFTIPLRKAFRKSHLKRTNYAVSLVKDFVKRHLKATEVKMGEKLNQAIWGRLPRNVRIQAVKEGDAAKAELFGYEYKEFKAKPKEEKKGLTEKLAERLGPKAVKKQEEENMVEGEKMQKPEAPQKVIIPKEEKG